MKTLCALIITCLLPIAASAQDPTTMQHVDSGEVAWTPWNPEMPDGPQISVIRGDMGEGPVQFLLSFAAGASSGMHSHTNTYTAVVVEGSVTRGPNAETLSTIGAGGYWVQPGGEVHIDNCASETACLIVITFRDTLDRIEAPTAE